MSDNVRRALRILFVLLLALAVTACGQTPTPPGDDGNGDDDGDNGGGGNPPPAPPAAHDTIAYVVGAGPSAGDEIRLIAPDGSGDRPLWSHGQDDPLDSYSVWSLEWNRQATRLTFASDHENWCSLFGSDIYTLGSDGSQYQRLTQAPACAELADYPTGTVQVPVRNDGFNSFTGFMYFQGAPSIKPVNLPPNATTTVVFEDVADFGDGQDWLQVAAIIDADYREILFSTLVDVQDGGSVTTAETPIYSPSLFWQAHSPSWRHDGGSVTFVIDFNSFIELPIDPGPLTFGEAIMDENADFPGFASLLARGPTAAAAEQTLYAGSDPFGSTAIYLVEDGGGPGEPLVVAPEFQRFLGLAWLPDASGFLFSLTEEDEATFQRAANLYRYDFASQSATRVTDYVDRFVGKLSVDGSGERVVYERASGYDDFTLELIDPDLHLHDLVSGSETPLVQDARAPAWSW